MSVAMCESRPGRHAQKARQGAGRSGGPVTVRVWALPSIDIFAIW